MPTPKQLNHLLPLIPYFCTLIHAMRKPFKIPILLILLGILTQTSLRAEKNTEANKTHAFIDSIYKTTLTKAECYNWLRSLCKEAPKRISGSENAAKAVQLMKKTMEALPFDKVYLQEVMVPKWIRGKQETGYYRTSNGMKISLNICALGGSIGTPKNGIQAQILEVKSLEDLKKLGKDKIKGKILFFNKPMNPAFLNTFDAYSDAVWQRGIGHIEGGKYGAVGVIIRSMSVGLNPYPHTGAIRKYVDSIPKIPTMAISTQDAEDLAKALEKDANLKVGFTADCLFEKDVLSYNVIGEILGTDSAYKNEVIAVGGHLDAWDMAEGAHDDGAGCVQSIQALITLKQMGYKPKRTLRTVLFMNEENGLYGGKKYYEVVKDSKEKHLAAIETDAGGFTPRGFTMEGTPNQLAILKSWSTYFNKYGINELESGHGGADISYLSKLNIPLIGLSPDSQRYFDFHHAKTDVFENVNKRELELGAAALSSLIYLLSENGF